MRRGTLHFIVPGSIDQRTGGYIYDARIIDGLRQRGWTVTVHELSGQFPSPDTTARHDLETVLAGLSEGATVVVDGLVLGALPRFPQAQRARFHMIGLAHLLLADETGLTPEARERLGTLERQGLAACDGVVATSQFTATRLAAAGVDAERIRCVPPGTDRARPARGPGGDRPPRLLCVASVTPRKGQDVLVEALEMVRDLAWQCVCAGSLTRDPVYADTVRRRVQDAGLTDRIELLGECDEQSVEHLYDTSSLLVLPSHFEGYGMVLTEAMARGLPVVTTTGGAIPFTVPADAGLFVPPGDAVALSQALRRLLSDMSDSAAPVRERLAAASLEYAATLPTWDDATDAFAAAVDVWEMERADVSRSE